MEFCSNRYEMRSTSENAAKRRVEGEWALIRSLAEMGPRKSMHSKESESGNLRRDAAWPEPVTIECTARGKKPPVRSCCLRRSAGAGVSDARICADVKLGMVLSANNAKDACRRRQEVLNEWGRFRQNQSPGGGRRQAPLGASVSPRSSLVDNFGLIGV